MATRRRRTAAEAARQIQQRLRVLQHHEQVTRNVSKTCRFCGVSRSQFYEWRSRFRAHGPAGLRPGRRGPKVSPFRLPRAVEDLILQVRRERGDGAGKIGLFLHRYHQTYVSVTIARVLRDHGVARLPRGRRAPLPRRRRRVLTTPDDNLR